MQTLTHFFQNQLPSSLCGINLLSLSIGSNCDGLDDSDAERFESKVHELVRSQLSESGIQIATSELNIPRLYVGISSRTARSTDASTSFQFYRVELSIREWLTQPRHPTKEVHADIWRGLSTVSSIAGDSTWTELLTAILQEVTRQVGTLRESLLFARLIDAAPALESRLPRIALLFQKYPTGTVEEVADLVGGRVASNIRDPNQPEYKNTCAIRVSRALNYSNAPIDRTVSGVRTNSGGDGKWYVFGIRDMKVYLTEKFGRPELKPSNATAADFQGKKGIIAFGNFHIDLWNNNAAAGTAYFGHADVRDPILLWPAP